MAQPLPGATKKGRASLVGGIAVGLAVLAIWTLLARDLGAGTALVIGFGAVVAALVAVWIRVADL